MNTKLHIQQLGQGPDLVLLHGWGFNASVWQSITPTLSHHFRLHLIDLPGHGHSPEFNIEHNAQLIAHCIAEQTPTGAIFLGWSMGGIISLALALQNPQHISKLILVASTPCFMNHDDWTNGVAPHVFQQFGESLQQNYNATIKRFLTLQSLGNASHRQQIKMLYTALTEQKQPSATALNAGLALLQHTDLRESLRSLQQDTLLIHSNDDKLVPLSAAQYLEATLPRSQLTVIEKTGHIPFINASDTFCQRIIDFCHDR